LCGQASVWVDRNISLRREPESPSAFAMAPVEPREADLEL
jgi:hypothetical protein